MKKICFFCICLMAALSVVAGTFFPSRTDFRDEQIYFVITTRFYDRHGLRVQ